MIVLDTNVISALMRHKPELSVIKWLDKQPAESIWITCVTLFEAQFGLARLPNGRRRQALELAFEALLLEDLDGRVLDFDQPAARAAATLAAHRERSGKSIDMRDTQIAGIVIARQARFATRNVKHFSDFNLEVMNPWAADP
jgi:predicted nucleic acid-binding protein